MADTDAGRVVRFADTVLTAGVAHHGDGVLSTARVLEREPGQLVTFVDLTVIPAGASVGVHTHGPDDEEIYVVIDGTGAIELEGLTTEIGPGDVVINPPGGTHGLRAIGPEPLRLVVVDVARVSRAARAGPGRAP